jgi:hypothetical protein
MGGEGWVAPRSTSYWLPAYMANEKLCNMKRWQYKKKHVANTSALYSFNPEIHERIQGNYHDVI